MHEVQHVCVCPSRRGPVCTVQVLSWLQAVGRPQQCSQSVASAPAKQAVCLQSVGSGKVELGQLGRKGSAGSAGSENSKSSLVSPPTELYELQSAGLLLGLPAEAGSGLSAVKAALHREHIRDCRLLCSEL